MLATLIRHQHGGYTISPGGLTAHGSFNPHPLRTQRYIPGHTVDDTVEALSILIRLERGCYKAREEMQDLAIELSILIHHESGCYTVSISANDSQSSFQFSSAMKADATPVAAASDHDV